LGSDGIETGAGGLAFAQGWHSRALVGPGWLASLRLAGTARSVEGRSLQLITGYVEACQFLTDRRWNRAAARRQPIGPASAMSVTEMDPPRHTVIRGVLSHAFSFQSLELMRSRREHRAAERLAVFVAPGPPADLVVSAGAGVEGVGQAGVEVEGCLERNDLQFWDGVRVRVGYDR
jgi:cytochrome P450